MKFVSELKRRNVIRVCAAYLLAAWGLLQAIDFFLDAIDAPNWILQWFIVGAFVGLPIVAVFSWIFEWTRAGIRRETDLEQEGDARRSTRGLDVMIIAFLLLAVIALLLERFYGPGTGPPTASAETVQRESIAVLPFRDMSAAGDQAYFGEGIAEELLNALAKLDGLKVASRTSSFALASEELDLPTIAGRLKVAHVLEGSIRTAGNQIRVTAQLIQVDSDAHLWSQVYDGSLDDIFQIQDEITAQIMEALKVTLAPAGDDIGNEPFTENAEAYRLYLRGRHFWRQRNNLALEQAIELYQRALDIDPEFHQAWAGLAMAYINLPTYDPSLNEAEYIDNGIKAADTALGIYPWSTDALLLKAHYLELGCHLNEAATIYEKALVSGPKDASAFHWYAVLLAYTGQTSRALEQIRAAFSLDPLDSAIISTEALILQAMGRYEEALELHRQASALGIFDGSLYELGLTYLTAGDLEQALPYLQPGRYPAATRHVEQINAVLGALQDPARWPDARSSLGKARAGEQYGNLDNALLLAAAASPYLFDYLSELQCPYLDTVSAFWAESFQEQRGTPEFFELMERAGVVDFWRTHGWPDDCASLNSALASCP